MSDCRFYTPAGIPVPAITAKGMREVDRVAVEEFGLGILQMMENAGRNLALNVLDMLGDSACESACRPACRPARAGTPPAAKDAPLPVLREKPAPVIAILAGSGGNGGGGLCCARHLHNRGLDVRLILSRDPGELAGAARVEIDKLRAAGLYPLTAGLHPLTAGLHPLAPSQAQAALSRAQIVVDALIGYSLRGAPRGRAAELIDTCNAHASRVLSLDLPSGLNATTGGTPGPIVRAERTLTLALPNTGLRHVPGDLYLADIGIPPEVYHRLDIPYEPPFGGRYWIRLLGHPQSA